MTKSEIFAIVNQKGGVGKTTTAITLGHDLARRGLKTLIVDLDVQGHVAWALGVDQQPGLYNLIVKGAPLDEVIIPSGRQRLDVLPGNQTTADVKMFLASKTLGAQGTLRKAIAPATEVYDYVLLDCSPTFDILSVNAIVAADRFIAPVKVDALALKGLADFINIAREVLADTGRALSVIVLPTMFDEVTNASRLALSQINEAFASFEGATLAAPIPADTRLRESPDRGQTIWEYMTQLHKPPKSAGAYLLLGDRVIERRRAAINIPPGVHCR